jgi:hypothetical protein
MAIKKYFANKDNTITNAFKANLSTRGVSGNMGQSDILEVFSIYAQANTASSELSRILIQFDTTDLSTDRTNGTIPASGSVSFYLRMFDAEHASTTPKDFTLVTSAVSRSWQEGLGLDMEDYSDKDASNWLYATDTNIVASASITVRANTAANTIHLTGSSTNYLFTSIDDSTPDPNKFHIGASAAACATNIAAIINTSASDDFSANAASDIVHITSSAAGATGNSNSLSSSATTVFDITGSSSSTNGGLSGTFGGGSNFVLWSSEGGDYWDDLSSSFSQSFDTGTEDFEIDISPLVEQWISSSANSLSAVNMGSRTNYGLGVFLTSSTENASSSYYTKRFFARGSEFFFKRPTLEARWDSSKKDNRGSFYLSSSLVPASDNLMNLYLYNVSRGQLKDIPGITTVGDPIYVSIFSGTLDNSALTGSSSVNGTDGKFPLPPGGDVVSDGRFEITGSKVETGIYSCSFAFNSSSVTTIFDVWHSGSTEYHTGSGVDVNTYNSSEYNYDQRYVSNIINLRSNYSRSETARLRLYTRLEDWSPTVYTVSSNTIATSIIDNVYYKVVRANDDLVVINYGTGSTNHTRLSYDNSGSYFDFDMGMLETNHTYKIHFSYLINGSYVEQPETFRFKVT